VCIFLSFKLVFKNIKLTLYFFVCLFFSSSFYYYYYLFYFEPVLMTRALTTDIPAMGSACRELLD
jgi:hypothetical protein